MRAAQMSLTEIARRLDQSAPRSDGGRWTRSRVDSILKNRVYRGEAYRGENVNADAHPPIVSVAEWQAANLVPVRAIARGKRQSLLGGFVRCAGCRYLLAPHRVEESEQAGGRAPVYRCRGTHIAGPCTAPASINGRKLDRYVERVWREQMAGEALTVQHDSEALQSATEKLSEAEAELQAFAADVTLRRVLGDGYHAAVEARATAVNQAQAELQRALAPAAGGEVIESYDDLPVEDRRRILGSSIDAVIVRRADARVVPLEERVTILWRGEGPEDLPRRGRDNGPVRAYGA
jgi:hypothetical protein